MERAILVEPDLKVHIKSMLNKCRSYKDSIMNVVINIILAAALLLAGYLILKYKAGNRSKKKTPEERDWERRTLIMKALGQQVKESPHKGPISGLPGFTSDVRFAAS